MPRKPNPSRKSDEADINPMSLKTISENGEAPKSRIRNAWQAWETCHQMETGDRNRANKRERIFRQYYRFPPTDYSVLVKLKREGDSNVNWGQCAFVVDNTKSSYYDMVTERTLAADIVTKKGNAQQQKTWSELISMGYDQYSLRDSDDYLLNVEMHQLDMMLYGKGVEMWDEILGDESEHCPVDEILVPDDTSIVLRKFDVLARKRKFHLHELWAKIENRSVAETRGWNVDAVINAIRFQRKEWSRGMTSEEFVHSVGSGSISLTSAMKEFVEVYILYVREFSGKISKHIVLRDYAPLFDLIKSVTKDKTTVDDGELVNDQGFLFTKTEFTDDLKKVFSVFIDEPGSGQWHHTPSLAEKVFVQCRQYDITMNNIIDAIRANMTLMLQASTPDGNDKLKDMVLGGLIVIPSDIQFAQQRVNMDVNEANTTLRLMMADMRSGIGNYEVQHQTERGNAVTATQSQLDAAESAKLKGTQIRRYNEQQTIYHQERFRRFVSLTRGSDGYSRFEKFKEFMRENQVPPSAYKWENIESVTSNMLAGAGSPSYKLMAAQKIIDFTNIVPKDEGQRAAVEDGIAALATRTNVKRYLVSKGKPSPDAEDRVIGMENVGFSDPNLNPMSLQVHPNDLHLKHLTGQNGHLEDMAQTTLKLENSLNQGTLKPEDAKSGMIKLLHQGGHINAHIQYVAKDPTKEAQAKELGKAMFSLQRQVQQLQQQLAQMQQQNSNQGLDPNDPDIQKAIALSQIQVHTAEQLSQIKIGSIAASHQTRQEITKEKGATDIAIARAKAKSAPKK